MPKPRAGLAFLFCCLFTLCLSPLCSSAQESIDTRVGTADWICEHDAGSAQPEGTLISGHQRITTAKTACANALRANPTWKVRFRSAAYRVTLPSSSPAAATMALTFDPTCSAIPTVDVKIGTAWVGDSMRICLGGLEKDTAVFAIEDVQPASPGLAIDAKTGAVSHSGAGPEGTGTFAVSILSSSGLRYLFTRPWRVAP